MIKINLKDNIKFHLKSGDKNKIHIDKNNAKKFFIKKPIVHGANIVIKSLNKKFFTDGLNLIEIKFIDFINIDEKFKIFNFKNHINIKSEYNDKILITKKYNSKLPSLKKNTIIKELLFISRYIGNINPGSNSLIQQIKFSYSSKFKKYRDFNNRAVTKNIKIISYKYKNLCIYIVAIKLVPFISNNIIKLDKNTLKLVKNKKILICGKNSDFCSFLIKSNLKKLCKISFLESKNLNLINLKKNLKKKPDYIFYFFSPKIIKGDAIKIYNNYLKIYKIIPKKIFEELISYKKNFKIFYPSSVFINNPKKYHYLKSYMNAKKESENEFNKKKYKNYFFISRLPVLKTRTNYDVISGRYLGKDLKCLTPIITKFFK